MNLRSRVKARLNGRFLQQRPGKATLQQQKTAFELALNGEALVVALGDEALALQAVEQLEEHSGGLVFGTRNALS
jgi:hypothetical protein